MGEHSKSSPGEACGTPAPQWGAGLDTFLAQVSQQVRARQPRVPTPRMRAREYVTWHNPTLEHAVCTITAACRGTVSHCRWRRCNTTLPSSNIMSAGTGPTFRLTLLLRPPWCVIHADLCQVHCTAFASRVAWLPSTSCQIAAVAAGARGAVDPNANALLCKCRSKRLLTQGRRRATSRS